MRCGEQRACIPCVTAGNLEQHAPRREQAGTIALSFMLFPKPFSMLYVYGTLLVLGGLTAYSYVKERRRAAKPRPSTPPHPDPASPRPHEPPSGGHSESAQRA